MTFYPRSLAQLWLALGRQLGRLGLYDESMNKRTTQTWGLNFYFSHLAMINYSEIQLRDDSAIFSMLFIPLFFFIVCRSYLDVHWLRNMMALSSWCRQFALSSFCQFFYRPSPSDDGCDADLCILSGRVLTVFDAQIKLSNSNIRLLIAVGPEKRQKIQTSSVDCCRGCWWKLRRNIFWVSEKFRLI